ncbi:nascent polypeptide-associated complex subunit alpha, muscle-specific form-like [Cydia pomonella]|uniref:nascent polypeptide-associated complex subunit alpha, muscle-specific form-like n=1 Tax=Cydia pomonella TaxID=82600 RepID=UPI002ADDB78C|nr:nascent polypeptide-associated complex subunit alpha, muscle-specific form-like [Cydia pomonella]
MPARRALRLLRPLFTQSRLCHSCQPPGGAPPCPPCEAAPPPPCRAPAAVAVPGRRVVCCPPPQGKRPPCPEKEPICSLTCEHQLPQEPPTKSTGPRKLCGAQRDVVAERIRCYEEHHRREYENAVKERMARPRTPPQPLKCPHPPEKPLELATDGRMYAVASDGPVPRCSPTPVKSSPNCPTSRPPHPPPQPVTLEPLGDCRPKERQVVDPCAHTPRTILSIDRGDPKPQPQIQSISQTKSKDPKPCHENPKNQTESSYKGITSRIMDSLRSSRTSPSKPKPEWCSKPPALAAAPKRCRQPTLTERMRRGSPSRNKRQLHTSVTNLADKEAPKASGREAALAASKKLAAALSERDSLKEAGRGRAVRAPSCAPPTPPPPPRPTGGAMEFSVPADADTVCVRVSMGKRPIPQGQPGTPTPKPHPGPSKPSPPPPSSGIPCPPQSASDSWLSIKKLQQKISSCGRDAPASPKPSAPPRPLPPCSPQGRAKMIDVLPHTIFIK